ncbi:hypothetical protein U1Q18_017849 [Sarracenia purpurea var. burkii]
MLKKDRFQGLKRSTPVLRMVRTSRPAKCSRICLKELLQGTAVRFQEVTKRSIPFFALTRLLILEMGKLSYLTDLVRESPKEDKGDSVGNACKVFGILPTPSSKAICDEPLPNAAHISWASVVAHGGLVIGVLLSRIKPVSIGLDFVVALD